MSFNSNKTDSNQTLSEYQSDSGVKCIMNKIELLKTSWVQPNWSILTLAGTTWVRSKIKNTQIRIRLINIQITKINMSNI